MFLRKATLSLLALVAILLAGLAPAAGRPAAATALSGDLSAALAGALCPGAPAAQTANGNAFAIDVQGHYAYVGDWGDPSTGAGQLSVFDIFDPCAPQLLGSVITSSPSSQELADLVVRDNVAYLANDANGLARYDVARRITPALLNQRNDGTYAHSVFYDGGRYAYVGQIFSPGHDLAIYDMTTFPASEPTFYAPTFDGHNSIYNVQVVGQRAYVMASDSMGTNHFQVLDLADPAAPTLLGDLALPQAEYGGVDGDLRVQGDYVYVATSTQVGTPVDHNGGLVVINVADPAAPQVAGTLFLEDAGRLPWKGTGLAVSGETVLLVGKSALYTINVANPAQPTVTEQQPFPETFGATLGGRVQIRGGYAYVAVYRDTDDSASKGGLAVYPFGGAACASTPALTTTFGTALAIDVQGAYAYVGDWGDPNGSGAGALHVFDVFDPCAPQLLGSAQTSSPGNNELGALVVRDGVAYVANDANGLARYDVVGQMTPAFIDQRNDGAASHSIAYDGGRYAYVGQLYASNHELVIYDMEAFQTAAPSFYVPTFANHRNIYDVQLRGQRAYLMAGDGGSNNHFQVLDLTDPAAPTLLGDLALPQAQYGGHGELRVRDDYVYLATSAAPDHLGGLVAIDIADEAHPQVAASAFLPNAANVPYLGTGLEIAGSQAYVVTKSGLAVFNISDPTRLRQKDMADLSFPPALGPALGGRVQIRGDLAYVTIYRDPGVSSSKGGLSVYRIDTALDMGFQPNPDGYSFANYGEVNADDYTIEDMRRMFGDAAVCVTTTPDCEPSQAALSWNEYANGTMDGGHCDGFASSSLLFFTGIDSPASFQAGATTTYDLLLGNARRNITYNSVKQLISPVGDYKESIRKNPPSVILAQLRESMLHNPATLFVRQAGQGGHAITPYAIVDQGGGVYWVKVYDNNHPNDTDRHVVINTVSESWSYDLGDLIWSGDANTQSMGIVPISLYAGPQACPFCSSGSTQADGAAAGQVWLDGPGHLLISDSQGRRIGYVGDQFVSEVAGAYNTFVDGGMGQAHEPIYTLPLTETYTIQLDGQSATASDAATQAQGGTAAVAQFGPGYAVAVEGLGVGPTSQSQIRFAADGTQASYQSDTAGEATLRLAHDGAGSSHQFSISGADVQAGQAVTMRLDTAQGNLAFSGAQANSSYDLAITRVSAAGSQTFTHPNVTIAASDTHYVDYSTWDGSGSVTVEIDRGGDGSIDETVELLNHNTVYLPLVRR